MVSTASIWHLAAISLDRLMAVVRPVTYMSLGLPSAAFSLLLVWLLALAICLPTVFSQVAFGDGYCSAGHSNWYLVSES